MTSDFATLVQAYPWFFPICAGVFGAVVGSFLNVVIYRVPAGKSVVSPGSHCGCGKPIAWYDNIPVLSWFILRGRARCCGARFSFRYPFVELLTAGLFVTCWLRFPPLVALCGMLLMACIVCATYIDLDHMIIPDVFTIGLGVVGVVLSAVVPALHGVQSDLALTAGIKSTVLSLEGMFVGSGLVLWIALVSEAILKKDAMGFGDVKFVGAIGAFAGWQGAVFSVFGGAIVGLVWILLAGVWRLVSGKRAPIAPKAETSEGEATEKLSFGVMIPFGPMLAVAGAIYFLWAQSWFDRYLAEFAALF